MKKAVLFLFMIVTLLCLCSCTAEQEEIPKQLPQTIPKAYTGDRQPADNVEIGTIEVETKETIFFINGQKYRFADFEKYDKRTASIDDKLMDIYVKDGKFIKAVIISEDGTEWNEYGPDGKALGSTRYMYDAYGNALQSSQYDSSGALTGFYEASYKDMQMITKKEFNATNDLLQVTKYYYDESGKLTAEAVYGADLKLKEIKKQ